MTPSERRVPSRYGCRAIRPAYAKRVTEADRSSLALDNRRGRLQGQLVDPDGKRGGRALGDKTQWRRPCFQTDRFRRKLWTLGDGGRRDRRQSLAPGLRKNLLPVLR